MDKWAASFQRLGGLLNEKCDFVVPAVQREYQWDPAKALRLVAHFPTTSWENSGRPKNDRQALLGPLFFQDKTVDAERKVYEVFDGQQRLTTLLIFLAVAKQRFVDLELADRVEGFLFTADDEPRIKLVYPVQDSTLNALLRGGAEPEGGCATIRGVQMAFEAFLDNDLGDCGTAEEMVSNLLDSAMFLVTANTGSAMSTAAADRLFSTVNMPGVALTAADHLKAALGTTIAAQWEGLLLESAQGDPGLNGGLELGNRRLASLLPHASRIVQRLVAAAEDRAPIVPREGEEPWMYLKRVVDERAMRGQQLIDLVLRPLVVANHKLTTAAAHLQGAPLKDQQTVSLGVRRDIRVLCLREDVMDVECKTVDSSVRTTVLLIVLALIGGQCVGRRGIILHGSNDRLLRGTESMVLRKDDDEATALLEVLFADSRRFMRELANAASREITKKIVGGLDFYHSGEGRVSRYLLFALDLLAVVKSAGQGAGGCFSVPLPKFGMLHKLQIEHFFPQSQINADRKTITKEWGRSWAGAHGSTMGPGRRRMICNSTGNLFLILGKLNATVGNKPRAEKRKIIFKEHKVNLPRTDSFLARGYTHRVTDVEDRTAADTEALTAHFGIEMDESVFRATRGTLHFSFCRHFNEATCKSREEVGQTRSQWLRNKGCKGCHTAKYIERAKAARARVPAAN